MEIVQVNILLDINRQSGERPFPRGNVAAARKMKSPDLPIGSEAILTIKRDKVTMTLNAKNRKSCRG